MNCPLCNDKVLVQESRRKKPFIRCDRCGLLLFVNKPFGIKKLRKATGIEDWSFDTKDSSKKNKEKGWF